MRLWRICPALYAATGVQAFDGVGGLYAHGRWHTKGRAIVYTATTETLARLEALVHVRPRLVRKLALVLVEATVPDHLIAALSGSLPLRWNDVPDSGATRPVGDAWLAAASSLALQVPSVLAAGEHNVLINPKHPYFSRLVIGAPQPFSFDPRLLDPKLRK